MSDRDLDRRCAEIVGWTDASDVEGIRWGIPPGTTRPRPFPDYSTSLDACRELLAFADGAGWIEFTSALANKVKQHDTGDEYLLAWWFLLATPRQICEAFVECFGWEK